MINSIHTYSHAFMKMFNDCVKSGNFLNILKYPDITPVYLKREMTDKVNYRPVSTLFNFSKIFEKLVYNVINLFMEPKLSKYLPGFPKNHNTQHASLKMTETWCSLL